MITDVVSGGIGDDSNGDDNGYGGDSMVRLEYGLTFDGDSGDRDANDL